MEFIKIYKTKVPNAKKTLEKKVSIAPLLDSVSSQNLMVPLSLLLKHGEVNFWDFGVQAFSQISVNDSVQIICGNICYSGEILYKINDQTGELGDLLGWDRLYNNTPWRNVCVITVKESTSITSGEIKEIVEKSKKTAANFYKLFLPSVKAAPFTEGEALELSLTTFERDPEARKACLDHYGTRCQACDLDFGETYGELGRGFIHVHHIKPLSQIREAHRVDPIRDLVPVCPNCHAMLHFKQSEPLLVNDLRAVIASIRLKK